MANHEDYLDALTAYARNPGPEIPSVLERYLTGVAKNGETLFQWPLLKPLIVGKMEQVIQELSQGLSAENIPARPNVENVRFEVMHARIMDALHKFNGAPFTIQRLCELLIDPKRHYKRSDKFMRGLEKNVLVVSTVDPFGRKVVSESSSKHLVNGMDSNGLPFLPRDPHTSTPLPPVPGWVTTSNLASRTHSSSPGSEEISDGHGAGQQDSGITSNGVSGGLVSSVYTDQGEQPLAVHGEEVIEETVVTMDTNEVTAVSTDGGESLAEEEEDEEMGGDDTNASSSSSSSSSSEELSISDSSDPSSAPPLSTTVSSSTESPPRDRPWASIAKEGEVTTVASNTSPQEGSTDKQQAKTESTASPDTAASSGDKLESTSSSESGQSEISTSLAWHPLTTTDPSDTSPSKPGAQTPSQSHSTESDPNNSFGFETVTTSAKETAPAKKTEPTDLEANSSSPLEDSGGVNDGSGGDQSPEKEVSPKKSEWPVDQTTNGSSGPILPLEPSQEYVASSSDSLYAGHGALSSGYIECDSVAGLERLVSSVDASSPITALSSSSSLSPSSALSPPPSHTTPVSTSPIASTNQSPCQSSVAEPSPQSDSEDLPEEPSAKRSKLSEDTDKHQEDVGQAEDISSSTSQDNVKGKEEDSNEESANSLPKSQDTESGEDNVTADTTSEVQTDTVEEETPCTEGEAESDSPSDMDGSGDEGREMSVSSPPSQLASSSDSQGFDMPQESSSVSGKSEKEDAKTSADDVTSASESEEEDKSVCGGEQEEPMEQE